MSTSIVPVRSREANIQGIAQIKPTETAQSLHFANITGLAATIIIIFSFSIISQSQAAAQTSARSDLAKILIGDSIHALQKGDSSGALLQMKLADQELVNAGNGTATQAAKVLVEDAIQSVLNTTSPKQFCIQISRVRNWPRLPEAYQDNNQRTR